ALTSAPGTGLPSAHWTRPVITNVRHHLSHRIHHGGVIMIGETASAALPPHWFGEIIAVRVWKLKISVSETFSGPTATARGWLESTSSFTSALPAVTATTCEVTFPPACTATLTRCCPRS